MTKPWSRKPMTPLMLDLLRWYASRLKGATPLQQNYRIRTGTFVGLIDRGLLAPYTTYAVEDDFTIGGHALTTAGLKQALVYVSDTATRRAVARQLIVDAAHFSALANETKDGNEANTLHAEAWAAEYAAGSPAPFAVEQGPKPINATLLLDEPACMVSSHRSNSERCTLPVSHAPGTNHSWAPADLAPSSTDVQRAALAADQNHMVRTGAAMDATTPENTPERVGTLEHERSLVEVRAELATDAEDSAVWPATEHERYGADERWTYVGPGGLFRLAGGPGAIDVYATIVVADRPGRFWLTMLGHSIGPIERDVNGLWREVP